LTGAQHYNTDPDAELGEVSPGGDALPGDGVWVSFSVLEGCLELTQLDAGEVTALTSTTAAAQLGRHRLQQRTCSFQKEVIFGGMPNFSYNTVQDMWKEAYAKSQLDLSSRFDAIPVCDRLTPTRTDTGPYIGQATTALP